MAGFPNRADRSSFGPTVVDENGQADPRKSVSAATTNLLLWQLGGLGMNAPMIVWHGSCGAGGTQGCDFMQFGFASTSGVADPGTKVAYTSIPYVTSAVAAGGQLTITFDTTVPDMDGNLVAWTLQGGVAHANPPASTPAARSELEIVSAQQVRVRVYDFATGVDIDPCDVTVAVW